MADWQNIRAQVDPNRNTIWVAEGTNIGYLSVFDGLYLFNTAWAANPGSVATQWARRVASAAPGVIPKAARKAAPKAGALA